MADEKRMSMSVQVEADVRWGELDAFEHVNNTVYFRWFEDARIAYFMACGVLEHLEATGVGPILGSTSCRFRRAVTFPDRVTVGASVERVDEDRFLMRYRVVSHGTGEVVAEGDGLVVMYDYTAGSKAPVPQAIRAGIQRLESGDVG